MVQLLDLLVQHAKLYFPTPITNLEADAIDISPLDVGQLSPEWKATQALRDDHLPTILCDALEVHLGNTSCMDVRGQKLLRHFSPYAERMGEGGLRGCWASPNNSAAQSEQLFFSGFLPAVEERVALIGHGSQFQCDLQHTVEDSSSTVYMIISEGGEQNVLLEVESPSVVCEVGRLLPSTGTNLLWRMGQQFLGRILCNVALCLGLRRLEWLFMTCHNYWIIFRLVKTDRGTHLAYSEMISIEDSSIPVRAFLGAFLAKKSIKTNCAHVQLDLAMSEGEDIEDQNRLNSESPGMSTDLLITSSSSNRLPKDQVWVPLHKISDDFSLPIAIGMVGRLWLTQPIGHGSTGQVWRCYFDGHKSFPFATKVVTILNPSDINERFNNELAVYRVLSKAEQSDQLEKQIAPRCYGAFASHDNRIFVLILELCENVLVDWKELSLAERLHLFSLVRDLHRLGIEHGDLEPRNIGRLHDGGLCLLDFSASAHHVCANSKPAKSGQGARTYSLELQTMRQDLRTSPTAASS